MKKLLSLLLALSLSCSLALPAAAEGNSDARLAALTLKVKDALALDTGTYDQFYGELSENELAPTWSLSWSGEAGSIEVTATEEGKVLSYYRYDSQESYDHDPLSLPAGSREQAAQAAQTFVSGLLGTGESVALETANYRNTLGASQYRFTGGICLNDLPSPLTCSVTVRGRDNAVTEFYRDDLSGAYMGGVPSADFKTSASAAKALLRGTLSLRLEYVLSEDGKTAVLRYLPNGIDEYYVDDVTGKLVNLTELYRQVADGGMGGENSGGAAPEASAAPDSANPALTQAEQTGADKLAGVLDKAALDKAARAISELGLAKYTLAAVSYDVERADPAETDPADATVTARLIYARQTDEGTWRRYVTLDGKTGELMSVYSSMPWTEGYKASLQQPAAQKKAESFLGKYYADEFAKTAAYECPGQGYWMNAENPHSWGFTYAQQENGYFFTANVLDIAIDASDGSVSSFDRSWDSQVSFDSADGLITPDQAVDAYLGTFALRSGYLAVPEKLDLSAPAWKPLAEMGCTYLYTLKLGYSLDVDLDGYFQGIDAKIGAPVVETYGEAGDLSYSDLDAAPWAKTAVETLAGYGVGYAADAFQPGKALTQLDLVALLASTQGYRTDPEHLAEGKADSLYDTAYSMGALTRADRDDDKRMTRMDVVKLLLDAGGYKGVAKLRGIYRVDFADAADIPDELLGYAALAQGLGVVGGDGAGRFAPGRTASRGEAAVMLCAFMSREK